MVDECRFSDNSDKSARVLLVFHLADRYSIIFITFQVLFSVGIVSCIDIAIGDQSQIPKANYADFN